MSSQRCWQVDRTHAGLSLGEFTATVAADNPRDGLCKLALRGAPIENTNLLGVNLLSAEQTKLGAVECYARGGDLIATYDETPQRRLRAQLYWRALLNDHPGVIAAVELLATVQTSLLDGRPQLTTQSTIASEEMFRLADPGRALFEQIKQFDDSESASPSCFAFRLASLPISYAEMVAPHVVQSTRLDVGQLQGSSRRVCLTHQLFAQRLEKGVILRARVLGLLLDRADDLAAVARHYLEFVSAAPPLTV